MQLLISNGHRFEDIKEYTMGQLQFFLEGVQEVEEERMKSNILSTLYGSRAEQKDLNKMLNQLDSAKIKNNFKDNFEES